MNAKQWYQRPLLLTKTPNTRDPQSFSLHSDLDPSLLSRNLRCPFPTNHPDISFRVVGSVDGLVCLSDDIFSHTFTVIIWNPSICRSLRIPSFANYFHYFGPTHFALGFGLDSSMNDYKLVRIVFPDSMVLNVARILDCMAQLPPLVQVYSLRERSWRPLSDAILDEYAIPKLVWSQCFIHGAVHWIASMPKKGMENVVLVFDLGTEVFKAMVLPECLVGVSPLRLEISVIGGLLAVLDRGEDPNMEEDNDDDDDAYRPPKISIWVKKQYDKEGAWDMILTIDENWELGLALHLRKEFGYDLHLPTFYDVFCFNTNPFFAFSYSESLVLLDEEHGGNAHQVCKDEEWIKRYPEGGSYAHCLDPEKEREIRSKMWEQCKVRFKRDRRWM